MSSFSNKGHVAQPVHYAWRRLGFFHWEHLKQSNVRSFTSRPVRISVSLTEAHLKSKEIWVVGTFGQTGKLKDKSEKHQEID